MHYLNYECINSLSSDAFQKRCPYPWVNIQNTLTPEGFERLRATLPDIEDFRRMVGVKRAYGQAPHDRAILHYLPGMPLTQPWKDFIDEVNGAHYNSFLHRMLGVPTGKQVILSMEWYYAWQGCAVSPHCDARRKLATHIFYLSSEQEWLSEWGGHILMLDDEKRFKATRGRPSTSSRSRKSWRPTATPACCSSEPSTRGTPCAPWVLPLRTSCESSSS